MSKKAILLIDLQGSMGGAQKRNLLLADFILHEREDFFLITNKLLYQNFRKNGIIKEQKNIILLNIDSQSKIEAPEQNIITQKMHNLFTEKNNLRSILGNFKSKLFLFMKWLKFIMQFRKIIKKHEIKYVYAIWTGGMWAWPLKRILDFKLIYGYNDADLSWLNPGIFTFLDSEYWVMKHANKIDFLSQGIRERFDQQVFKISEHKIKISPCSFVIYDNYFPVYPKKNHVVFLGRLHKDRNPMLILQAIKLYQSLYPEDIHSFFFIGDGALTEPMRSFIETENLRNVNMIGNRFDPWTFLKESKVFITVANENYPSQSLLEAMACENAIIASDVGETRKLVTDKEGILVQLDSSEICDALEKLLNDEELIKKMGKNSRAKALSNHNINKYSKYFLNLFEE